MNSQFNRKDRKMVFENMKTFQTHSWLKKTNKNNDILFLTHKLENKSIKKEC